MFEKIILHEYDSLFLICAKSKTADNELAAFSAFTAGFNHSSNVIKMYIYSIHCSVHVV